MKGFIFELSDLSIHPPSPAEALGTLLVCVAVLRLVKKWRLNRCYLLAYTCYKPPDERKLNTETSEYVIRKSEPPPESLRFQVNVHIKSGLGQQTYAPNSFFQQPVVSSMSEGWLEMQEAFAATLRRLFDQTEIRPCDVDILIVNVCCFAPAPSLSSWIVNHFGLREDVRAYNISGMGCSAGVIALGLARDLLRVHENSYAVLVSTENLTMNRYEGNDKSMMMSNCLFRVGGSSLLLSNKAKDKGRAKMELIRLVRTHLGCNDQAYNSIVQREDDEDVMGVSLSTYLIEAAGIALKNNITTLATKVLPISEQIYFVYNLFCIRVLKASVKPYVPNFRPSQVVAVDLNVPISNDQLKSKIWVVVSNSDLPTSYAYREVRFRLAFEHFCIHPGGRAVINGIGKNLKLTDYDIEPAHMTLHRFGNTSSSGLWYEMAYMEAKRRVKKGDRVWQIALGSGFKCNTVVWKVLKKPNPVEYNVWSDCIDDYPCNTRNPFEQEYKQRFNLLSKQS